MELRRDGEELHLTIVGPSEKSAFVAICALFAVVSGRTRREARRADRLARKLVELRDESMPCYYESMPSSGGKSFSISVSGDDASVALRSLCWYVESAQHLDDASMLPSGLQRESIRLYLEASAWSDGDLQRRQVASSLGE